ncbi:MAG: CDP-glucose 4,6-dehydratase, partial [Bdellovibrionales bacterium]|nr:CDP-glucose 4,6-dehydratase [Bdellovibrionales bacterium]
ENYQTNVMGTANLLQSCRDLKSVKSVVVVTSDKCYENVEQIWGYREHDKLGGYDPYSNSKACAELVVDAWRNSFFKQAILKKEFGLASARAGNVIGGGDWSTDRLIPDIVRAYENNQAVRIRNPRSIRPWQHVLDPLMGYLILAENLCQDPVKFSRAWNFGPLHLDSACEVNEILKKAKAELGSKFQSEIDPGPHPHEANYLKLDCSLAAEVLRWKPIWEVDDALRATFQWYNAFLGSPSAGSEKTWTQTRSHLRTWQKASQ